MRIRALLLISVIAGCAARPPADTGAAPRPAAQNPSPMVESTRAHRRLAEREHPGHTASIDGVLPRPVHLYIPSRADSASVAGLVVHFLGAPFVAREAVAALAEPYVLAVVNLGAGSAVYERPFLDSTAFSRLADSVRAHASRLLGRAVALPRVYLTAYSAGYGAVRAIIDTPGHAPRVTGVLLLDGLHASYIPERKVIAEGGRIDSTRLEPFVRLARRAAGGETRLIVTHSEVFPGTFASTTETTDYLLRAIGLTRTPVLEWGPVGMQQLSEARRGSFHLMGFAGNSAPDHADHLHALSAWLPELVR
jgi:hypothetical protein